jgi:hypothetical protein
MGAAKIMEDAEELRVFDWPRLVRDVQLMVAEYLVPETDTIYLAAYWPVPSSDLGIWYFIHKDTDLLKAALRSTYKRRLVHIRHAEHGSDSLRRRRNHFPYHVYLRIDIRSFAGVVLMLNGSSLCHYPVDEFGRLKVLALDVWPSNALYKLLAERTIFRPERNDGTRPQRPTVRILATVSDLSYQAEPDDVLAGKLKTIFDIARQQYQFAVVRVPPKLEEIRIKTNFVPREFNALQDQIFHEPGEGDWSFKTTKLARPGEFMLVWTLQSDADLEPASGETSFGSSTDLDQERLSIDEYLKMADLLS